MFPFYYKVQNAKQECYPPKDDITLTDTTARIKLQPLLDITAKRIFKAINIDSTDCKELTMISKWGMDGASNQANYKQKMTTDDKEDSASTKKSLTFVIAYHDRW